MYLLNPEQGDKITYELKFTFHYVSIKSVVREYRLLEILHLHSTMYLLNRYPHYKTLVSSMIFTFHYVSIKSSTFKSMIIYIYYLHSTMYLLNQNQRCQQVILKLYLHSTMYLLNRLNNLACKWLYLIYIPLCIY